MRFSVWAPYARKVELVLRETRHEMRRGGRGWFEADVDAKHGDYYSYSVDGTEPLPDPRSPWQPLGPHGASRVVDHDRFVWHDSGFRPAALPRAVIYELHVGTFTPEGTFEAAIERLDHLVALGVTHVELLPVNEFPGDHGWGYDGVDLYAPHHAYGGPESLKRLVDACHDRGLGVLMDVVYNHLGPSGNYLGRFGPYFTDAYSTPWGDALNFDDMDSDEVRAYFVDNALMWLRDYHCDGLRLDAVHAIVDESALHILEEIGLRVGELGAETGRELVVIAESDLNNPRVVARRDVGGYGLDAQWSDDFHHALHSVLTGEINGYYSDFGKIEHLAVALQRAYVYAGEYSPHRRRRHGRPPEGIPAYRFLGYIQNHDQIGNRARGERLSQVVPVELAKLAAAVVLMAPFVPMLFQGEEWAASSPFRYFTDHPDEELGRAVSEGRKREFASFGWDPADVPDPQDPETFERSKLVWDELHGDPHAGVLEWHRRLIALRKDHPEVCEGAFAEVRFDEAERWLVFDNGPLTVSCSFEEGRKPPEVDGEIVLSSEQVTVTRRS